MWGWSSLNNSSDTITIELLCDPSFLLDKKNDAYIYCSSLFIQRIFLEETAPMKIRDLIEFIVRYATQQDIKLTTIRLVKFIYLADLYYARDYQGTTLTDLPWAFVHYGPYCREVMQEIDKAVLSGNVCKESYESKYDKGEEYHLFSCIDNNIDSLEMLFPIGVTSQLKATIKRYGDDTASLLDYIYFETEPMIDAKKGDLLNFSKAKPFYKVKPVQLKKIPKDKIELAKKHVRALGEKFKDGQKNLKAEDAEINKIWKDEAYYCAIEMINEDDLETGLKGIAKILN